MSKNAKSFIAPEPAEVAEIRKALRMTQESLADALGVHPRTVQNWELGSTRVSRLGWLSLCRYAATRTPKA